MFSLSAISSGAALISADCCVGLELNGVDSAGGEAAASGSSMATLLGAEEGFGAVTRASSTRALGKEATADGMLTLSECPSPDRPACEVLL